MKAASTIILIIALCKANYAEKLSNDISPNSRAGAPQQQQEVFFGIHSTTASMQENVDWAFSNATQLSLDLLKLRLEFLLYYERLVIDTAIDFQRIIDLLESLQVNAEEVERLNELLTTSRDEIKFIIENHVNQVESLEFHCIEIKSNLKVHLDKTKLTFQQTTLSSSMRQLILDMDTSAKVIDLLYIEVRQAVLASVEGMNGSSVDEVVYLLDKVQSDLGTRRVEVRNAASETVEQGAQLNQLLSWIIVQLPYFL